MELGLIKMNKDLWVVSEMLGLVYAKDVINELGRRLGCYVADQEIWLSYDHVNKTKTEKIEEK